MGRCSNDGNLNLHRRADAAGRVSCGVFRGLYVYVK